MKSVLLVSETDQGFHKKLNRVTAASFEKAGFEVHTSDEFANDRFNLAHYNRLLDPCELLKILDVGGWTGADKLSFLIGGLAENLRDAPRKRSLEALSHHPKIAKIFILSNHPESVRRYCRENWYLQSDKVVIMHLPVYEKASDYRKISKSEAREALKIAKDVKLALYFGTYWYSRGPDLLLKAAKQLPDVDFAFVGSTKIKSIDISPKDYAEWPNIRFVDRWVSDKTARMWFRACDLVVLPYRKFYEHDSSGVFDQAMLAERPVLMPDFSPFWDVFDNFPCLGIAANTEDAGSLSLSIELIPLFKTNEWCGFDDYLNKKDTWDRIGEELA